MACHNDNIIIIALKGAIQDFHNLPTDFDLNVFLLKRLDRVASQNHDVIIIALKGVIRDFDNLLIAP